MSDAVAAAWEAANRFRAEQGLPPLPGPRFRRELLPRWHPNNQRYLRGRYEHGAPGAYLCICAHCEREFYADHPAGYCSPACSDAARHERERQRRAITKAGRTCAYCRSPLPVTARADSRYCSSALPAGRLSGASGTAYEP